MKHTITLQLSPKEASDKEVILNKCNKKINAPGFKTRDFLILRKSIDARKKPVKVNLTILASDTEGELQEHSIVKKEYRHVSPDAPQIIIVGAGPAGLFAALKAIELGIKPIVIDRGKDVDSRRKDIALISRENKIDPDSNFCFGEGGAGTFSDGKLYTRSKKRGNNREVLEILHQFGADEEILVSSHPHIGSDRLPGIIKSIRNKIVECGGEVHFGCKMEALIIEAGKAKGIVSSNKEKFMGPVFLAIGHSARDTFRRLYQEGVKMEPKGLAIGVRLEHPQHLIDRIQYHSKEGRGKWLPAAEYSFVAQSQGRGVYTFCMCPGGVIVPAVSEKGQIVVNGMSASARSSKWANSGFVVELHPGDVPGFEYNKTFEMMALQENLESSFYEKNNDHLEAPAQKLMDFIDGKLSQDLPSTSYAPGIHPADFNTLFPKEISERLKEGLLQIKNKCESFVTNEGLMIGLESRTSSPIRIPRNPETLMHEDIEDLYPIGEGAGYAGGIISSAIDGIRSVTSYYNRFHGNNN